MKGGKKSRRQEEREREKEHGTRIYTGVPLVTALHL